MGEREEDISETYGRVDSERELEECGNRAVQRGTDQDEEISKVGYITKSTECKKQK